MVKNKAGWEIKGEHIYEAFKIFTAKRSSRVNPRTGEPFDFFLLESLDWVNVLPITARGEAVLIRQYRHGADEFTIEAPGGCVDPGEDPAASALRELREETGYGYPPGKEKLEHLASIYPNPAMLSNRVHYYVAKGVEKLGPQHLDSGEDIEVVLKPLHEALDMVRRGEINHALSSNLFGMFALKGDKTT
jgi:8-oxo-dGTP pyrophosphatase MutT (NUDIX family)